MRCRGCLQERFLVRNYCKSCDPQKHEAYEAAKRAFDRVFEKYVEITGKQPLHDWIRFVVWATKHMPDDWALANTRI